MSFRIGGQIKELDDLDKLQDAGMNLGEVFLGGEEKRNYWRSAGLSAEHYPDMVLLAHGPAEGAPQDMVNLESRYFPELYETVDLAHDMRIEYLTAHLWIDSRFVSPKIMEAKISLLKELTAYARSRSVRISLENLSEGAIDLRRAVEAIPDLMITLDIGHGQLLCRENRSFEILEILADHVGELHAHDNMGGTGPNDDLHLPLGQGVIDFGSILKKAVECGFDGPVILELAHHDLPESMAKLEHLWRRASMSTVSPTPL